ncbi:GNAT family N-acetyltransferase [Paenibacillus selenitireducens]|jgi:hypothetical protein|uniref:GNAT family N-acetyltransferase n=1 Tax=Paenibacillus selenitireducens TaxID=1324314 RepID=A0A1T2XIB3_9BACL|nr:GNAT family N-acetyltransferase [Paenibacillus selenitireducens]OPA79446.1 GNAT family N-acetyltransferase [Paenibacillus selenitireducens]
MPSFTMKTPWVKPHIRAEQATTADTEAVMQLLKQTALWLLSQGSTQWSSLIDGEDVHGTANSIERGDVFIFRHVERGDLAGVVILLQQPSAWDLELWGDRDPANAVFLHRLAINRNDAGTQLGEAIMNWASEGIRFEGKDVIRLDCIATNEKLFSFYTSLGYTHQGEHASGFHIFEKAILK